MTHPTSPAPTLAERLRDAHWLENGEESDAPYLAADELDRLTAEVERLRAALLAWDDAVRIDVVMDGPRYMGVDIRRGRDAWEKTKVALEDRT